jgi:molybdenum cofactor cytidylyltransferase
MAGSIACGVNAADDADGWVIALADMPLLRTSSVAQVAAAIAFGARIAAPLYQGRRGHPVGFSREFGPALRALHGDMGARHLLRQHRDALVELTLDDPGTVIDIDIPTDLPRPHAGVKT